MATGKKFAAFIFLIHNLLFISTIYSQSSWNWVQPKPSGNLLYSVHFVNQFTGYACGALGTIIKTTNSGVNWKPVNSATSQDLSEVYFINEKSGIAVGKAGTIIVTSDEGNHWAVKTSGTQNYLHDIAFTDQGTGYICGLAGTILKTTDKGMTWKLLIPNTNAALFCIDFLNQNTGIAGGYNTILKTTNAGLSWITQNANIVPSSSVVGISITDSSTIYAAGNSPGGMIYKSTNSGSNWQKMPLGLPYLFGGSVDLVRSLDFMNSISGFVITDFGTILRTTNSGETWEKDSLFRPSYDKLSIMYDIDVLDSDFVYTCGGGGTVIGSSNAGLNWIALSGNKKTLRASFFINQKTGYCAGEYGELLKTGNGGMSWSSVETLVTIFFKSVFFLNEDAGFIGGDSGKIIKTLDGGKSFNGQFTTRQQNINSINFINENTGFAAGGSDQRAFIYRTSNSGYNWYEVFDSLSFGNLNCISFINRSFAIIAADNGNIMITQDTGLSWNCFNISSEDLKSISFSDESNGLISGSNGIILKTTDAGVSWIRQTSGTFRTLNSVKYSHDNFAIAAGDNGITVRTKNGGQIWSLDPRISDNNLYSVNIVSHNNLISSGEYGTILNATMKNFPVSLVKKDPVTKTLILEGNFPNPFNPKTIIKYQLLQDGHVTLKVYNVLGKEVASLINENQKTGSYSKSFEGSDLPSGMYFYCLSINGETTTTRQMTLLK